jgi:hypothetical protein
MSNAQTVTNLNPPNLTAAHDLTAALLHLTSQPTFDAHAALTIVFKALAGNHITQKRAATMGYLIQLILISDPNYRRHSPRIDPDKSSSNSVKYVKTSLIDEENMQNLLAAVRKKFPKLAESPRFSRHSSPLR